MRSISATKLMDFFRPPTAIVQMELSKARVRLCLFQEDCCKGMETICTFWWTLTILIAIIGHVRCADSVRGIHLHYLVIPNGVFLRAFLFNIVR